ncbi:hypothetical protein OH779_26995 [Actinacidiphila glaucinigra]|uniref:hypothetical protein n=1 Tax=Actinacidiphila glaucinigra TaxID=235986 RepID=UPI00386DB4CE
MLYDTVPAEARRNDAIDDVPSGALDRARWLLDLLDRGRAEFRLAFGTRKGEYRRLEELHAGIRAEIDEGLATRSDDELRAAALSLLLVAARTAPACGTTATGSRPSYPAGADGRPARSRSCCCASASTARAIGSRNRWGRCSTPSTGSTPTAAVRSPPTCARRTEGSWPRKSARTRVDRSAGVCARCWRTRTPPCRTS